jgi:hypothetical protein
MTRRLFSNSMPQSLLASLENGVIFEDALGRSSILSCNYLQSWEVQLSSLKYNFIALTIAFRWLLVFSDCGFEAYRENIMCEPVCSTY